MHFLKFERSKSYKIQTFPGFGKRGDLNICEDVSYVHAIFYHETVSELTVLYSNAVYNKIYNNTDYKIKLTELKYL